MGEKHDCNIQQEQVGDVLMLTLKNSGKQSSRWRKEKWLTFTMRTSKRNRCLEYF